MGTCLQINYFGKGFSIFTGNCILTAVNLILPGLYCSKWGSQVLNEESLSVTIYSGYDTQHAIVDNSQYRVSYSVIVMKIQGVFK